MADYYNRQQRTILDFFRDSEKMGFDNAAAERKALGEMQITPTDIEDLQGFTPVIKGKSATQNWMGIFKPGERVRLRIINSAAMPYIDNRIPGLKMTVFQAHGQNVRPVPVGRLDREALNAAKIGVPLKLFNKVIWIAVTRFLWRFRPDNRNAEARFGHEVYLGGRSDYCISPDHGHNVKCA